MSLTVITELRSREEARLNHTIGEAKTSIENLRRMAADAIANIDERHKNDTGAIVVLFDELISFEQKRLDEASAELGGPQIFPAITERKRRA